MLKLINITPHNFIEVTARLSTNGNPKLKRKKIKLFKNTFATAARCQLGASKRRQQDIDLWRLNETKHKQQPLGGSYSDLERIPVEYFGFYDELWTAVGPCDHTCIILI